MRGHEKFTTSLEISSSPPPSINNDCSLDSCVLISGFILAHVCWSDAVVSSIVFITESQLRICSLPTVYCLSTWKIKDSWWCAKWFLSARRMQRTHFMAVYLYAINSAMSPLIKLESWENLWKDNSGFFTLSLLQSGTQQVVPPYFLFLVSSPFLLSMFMKTLVQKQSKTGQVDSPTSEWY